MSKRLAALWSAAVALPVLPSAVNLAHGQPLWIDGDSTSSAFFLAFVADGLLTLWTIFSLVVGAGGMVALVLLAVALRRRRWAILASAAILLLVAMIGILSVAPISRTAARLLDGSAGITAGSQPDFYMGYLEGSIRLMPSSISWAGEGREGISPLWFSAAFAGSAVLLILLSRGIRRRRPDAMGARRRPAPLPVRWRTSLTLWTAALVLVCAPYGFFLFASETVEYGMTPYLVDACPGFQLYAVAVMHISPLFLLSAPPAIAIGFGAWTLLARKGQVWQGLAAGWLSVIPLTLYGTIMFGMVGLDGVNGQDCQAPWNEYLDLRMAAWQLYNLLVAVLVILAVRVRRGGPPYRSRTSRTVAALALGVLLLTVMRTDSASGQVTSASSETCEPWDTHGLPVEQPVPSGWEIAFACAARQSPMP
ncbi:hypothetical protein SAMN05216276_104256 [Streptosporangium subroseum]|uniref:Uncharacterized protein n=1 Tax=Streptosporangium subroseum TaxID=106412 RepID=A0A239MLY7_9ACTN|nr:hypothetical protein [Streptosporangium subroseum]SNT43008.1 hypothetical protein SAMN05216276_104256 [Streptosporangium subroseum]